jgi:hypothetical protein
MMDNGFVIAILNIGLDGILFTFIAYLRRFVNSEYMASKDWKIAINYLKMMWKETMTSQLRYCQVYEWI